MAGMRWNPFRPAPSPDAQETDQGAPGKPATDKLTMAIRQRRMFTAQQRVDQLPGFAKLERRWCEYPAADELDARRAALDAGARTRWSDADILAAALSAAASSAPSTPAQAFVLHEPEARWVEARQGDLLNAIAAALPALPLGATMCAGNGCALEIFPWADADAGDRPSFETTLHGEWPDGVREVLAPTMPR